MHARCKGTSGDRAVTGRRYLDRDIRPCPEWTGRHGGFEAFFAHMGECPPGMTLDRIDNERGYEPGNCRWVNMKAQSRNRTTNVWVDYQGQRMILADACAAAGIKGPHIYPIMAKHKLSVQEAFTLRAAQVARKAAASVA